MIKAQELQGAVLFQRPVQVPQLPTDPGDDRVISQALAGGIREQTQGFSPGVRFIKMVTAGGCWQMWNRVELT